MSFYVSQFDRVNRNFINNTLLNHSITISCDRLRPVPCKRFKSNISHDIPNQSNVDLFGYKLNIMVPIKSTLESYLKLHVFPNKLDDFIFPFA